MDVDISPYIRGNLEGDIQLTAEERNLHLLQQLIPQDDRLYLWVYNTKGQLVAALHPEQTVLQQAFERLGARDKALALCLAPDWEKLPALLGSPIGLQWAVTMESQQDRALLFVIGPVFYTQPVESTVRSALNACIQSASDREWAEDFLATLSDTPVLSYPVLMRYVVLIHNALTGAQRGMDALAAGALPETHMPFHYSARDRRQVYAAEQVLLQMVRTGDICYQSALRNSMLLSPGVPVHGRDPLRQAKTSATVFTTLATRAAIEGGLSPEIAYALGDSYIQAVEDCQDSAEISTLSYAMYHDFIFRVHQLHQGSQCSHAIQKCCDYIDLNLDKQIRMGDLASLVGYTEYYLSEKFKKEVGMTVKQYMRRAKIERAKILLSFTQDSVQEIADALGYNTANYFIQSFRDTVGETPAQYRKKHQIL